MQNSLSLLSAALIPAASDVKHASWSIQIKHHFFVLPPLYRQLSPEFMVLFIR